MAGMPPTIGHELPYRADIDGLRAISVGLVMAFHMASGAMPGGFVGVDVFFVISGYLISGLILAGLRAGHFTLTGFYVRRIRRIVPALFTVVAVTIALGCIVLMPGDLRETARSGLYALFGASNFYFLAHTGYFDITAEMLPFLHTWSLGVEEQFYLVWPLFLMVLFRLTRGRRGPMALVIAVVVAASFAASLLVLQKSPKHAFYLPFTRAWQLGLGALLIFLPAFGRSAAARIAAQALPLAGMAMILAAGLLLRQGTPYPGVNALLPALGAALVICDAGGGSIGRGLLSLPPMVFIGRISYSLYLWHWPILVLWRHLVNGDAPSGGEAAALAALAVVAATLSWRFVEMPARRGALPAAKVFTRAAVAAASIGVASAAIVRADGLPGRIAPEALALSSLDGMWRWSCPQTVPLPITRFGDPSRNETLCGFGADWKSARQRALLWGDSNAEHLLPLLHEAGVGSDTAFALVNPCPAIINATFKAFRPDLPSYAEDCAAQQRSVIAYLKAADDLTHVVLAARWSVMQNLLRGAAEAPQDTAAGLRIFDAGLKDLLSQIASPKRTVILFNDIPLVPVPDVTACILSRITLPRARICRYDLETLTYQAVTIGQKPSHDIVRDAGRQFAGTVVISPEDRLCGEGRCPMQIGGEFIYRDNVHFRRNLSADTNRELSRRLGFDALLRRPGIVGRTN